MFFLSLLFCEFQALSTPPYSDDITPYYSSNSPYRPPYYRSLYPEGRIPPYRSPVYRSISYCTSPCHYTDRATDDQLRCDPSPHQILFIPGAQNQTHAEQKENLIILDIDQTILDSHEGADGPLFYKYARYGRGYAVKPKEDNDLVLMCLQDPKPFSIVFRKGFFEFLRYVYEDVGFHADLVVYTRARHDYAVNVVMGINSYYDKNYRSHHNDVPGMHYLHFLSCMHDT